MGTDDIFKKRHAQLVARKEAIRNPKPNSFLIVTEGTKTEPLYFNGMAEYINHKYGSNINVIQPIIDTHGEGMCTVSLVSETERIISRAPIIYSQVWVVFDKDDFEDFDEAIILAQNKGYNVGWSNQSFEYWIYLHFEYSDAALHRNNWCEKLSEIYKHNKISDAGYEKNDKRIFEIVTTNGSLKSAVKSATHIEHLYDNVSLPSLKDPCTTVHHLILALKDYLAELL